MASPDEIVSLQLPFSPMRVFAIRIELTHEMTVQRPRDADARKTSLGRPASPPGSAPPWQLATRLLHERPSELRDVAASVLEGDERRAARKQDRLVEWPFPTLAANDVGPPRRTHPAAAAGARRRSDCTKGMVPPQL
jgi:hypothetical protein